MRAAASWTAGLTLSALVHAVAAVVLVPLYAPRNPPSQPPPETRLDMETVAAPQQDAAARDPQAETAAETAAEGASLGAGAVPLSDARPVAAEADRQPAVPPDAQRTAAADPSGTALAQVDPDAGRVSAAAPGSETLPAESLETSVASQAATPQAQAIVPAAVDASSLSPTRPEGTRAQADAPAADTVSAAEPDGETARPAAPDPIELAETTAPAAEPLPAAQPAPDRVTVAEPRPDIAAPAQLAADDLAAAQPETATSLAGTPPVTAADALVPGAVAVAAMTPDRTTGAALSPVPEAASAVTATPETLASAQATGRQMAALATEGTPLPQARTDAARAAEAAPSATSATATLAWQFGDRIVTDPQALATIQAFMEPAALDDAQGVKDDLSSVLADVECARLSATFIPETGTLEMRGHIPDPELRGPILAALQARVGDGIPVTANLLHLPAPQCSALTGIASVGLPQSTDQFTNARLVGETAHARDYSYTEGQRLRFDLTAPDYDAYIYVDYFNADGEVIHLVPNETIPLEEHAAKSVFGVGQDRPGRPGLRITIGPPYGQEIAVAFAASHRLYDGVRPIVEPAAPYLEDLQALVAEARAAHDDFKGEWVYFFITTSPATQ